MPNFQPFWVILAPPGQPDKKRLMTVQDFFKYTEEEGTVAATQQSREPCCEATSWIQTLFFFIFSSGEEHQFTAL